MKVKILKAIKVNGARIEKNEILNVRLLRDHPFDTSPRFQIIEGKHSGEFLQQHHFIEVRTEKIFTEKQMVDMENSYSRRLDDARKRIKEITLENENLKEKLKEANMRDVAELPTPVYEAFLRLEREWKKYMDKKNIDLLLMTILGIHAVGDALTLKTFALQNPTTYMQAVLNGYTLLEKEPEKAEC